MNEYVVAGKKLYPLKDKIIRSKAGKQYLNKHVKITVATDYYSGRQIQHDYTGKNNYEVQSKIDESVCLSDEQLNLIPNDINLEQLFNEYFDYKTGQVSTSYLTMLRNLAARHILPKLGKVLIRNIKKEDIINLQKEIKIPSGKIISFYLMKITFDYARKKGYISCNPCKYTQIFQRNKDPQTILNKDQIYKLLVTEKNNIYSGLYAVILLLALRFGEGIGLSWKQINFDRRTVTISQQITSRNKLQDSTKTRTNRCIDAPECVFYYLERQKNFQEFQKLNNPNWNNIHDLVFTGKDGKPLCRNSVAKMFKKIMQDTSNPAVTLHSLRRTTATILAENVSVTAAQYYLGHVCEGSSVKYIYPTSNETEHLVKVMAEHFNTAFNAANLKEFY